MRKPTRTPDRQAVARSLRELEALFKRPPEKEIAAGKSGEIGTTEIELQPNNITKNGVAI